MAITFWPRTLARITVGMEEMENSTLFDSTAFIAPMPVMTVCFILRPRLVQKPISSAM